MPPELRGPSHTEFRAPGPLRWHPADFAKTASHLRHGACPRDGGRTAVRRHGPCHGRDGGSEYGSGCQAPGGLRRPRRLVRLRAAGADPGRRDVSALGPQLRLTGGEEGGIGPDGRHLLGSHHRRHDRRSSMPSAGAPIWSPSPSAATTSASRPSWGPARRSRPPTPRASVPWPGPSRVPSSVTRGTTERPRTGAHGRGFSPLTGRYGRAKPSSSAAAANPAAPHRCLACSGVDSERSSARSR